MNPILEAEYDPRVEETKDPAGGYQVSSFPYCCGLSIVTGLPNIKNLKLFSAWYTKTGGALLYTHKASYFKQSPKFLERLLEADWVKTTTFLSRMAGNYNDEIWIYTGKKEDIISPIIVLQLNSRSYWKHQITEENRGYLYKRTSVAKGPYPESLYGERSTAFATEGTLIVHD